MKHKLPIAWVGFDQRRGHSNVLVNLEQWTRPERDGQPIPRLRSPPCRGVPDVRPARHAWREPRCWQVPWRESVVATVGALVAVVARGWLSEAAGVVAVRGCSVVRVSSTCVRGCRSIRRHYWRYWIVRIQGGIAIGVATVRSVKRVGVSLVLEWTQRALSGFASGARPRSVSPYE